MQKVYEDRDVLAFRHPRPSYENHLILTPKRAVQNLQQMARDDGGSAFAKIWRAVETVRARRPEYQSGFTLVANGGKRQDVQQVHFHMFTGDAVVNAYPAREPGGSAAFQDGTVIVLKHPRPNWETHYVVLPCAPETGSGEAAERYFGAVLQSIERLDEAFGLVQHGYSLVCRCGVGSAEAGLPVFHIVAGRRTGSRRGRPAPVGFCMFCMSLRQRPQRENDGQVKMCLGTGAVQPEKRRGRTQTVVENSEKWRFFASFASCTLCIFLQSGVLRGEVRADRKAAGQTENEGRRFLGKRSSEGFAERRETAGPAPLWRKKGPKPEKKS